MSSSDPLMNVSIGDVIANMHPDALFEDQIVIMELDGLVGRSEAQKIPLKFEAVSITLIERGEISIEIDYLTYLLKKNMMLMMTDRHTVENINMSNNLKGYSVFITKELMPHLLKDMRQAMPMSAFTSPRRLTPMDSIEPDEMRYLIRLLEHAKRYMEQKDHIFRHGLVHHTMSIFLLELINILFQKEKGLKETKSLNQTNQIVFNFIKLLLENCKRQHEVTFYSNELCITAEHLSKTLKAFSGKTATKWIADALIVEAKIMLREPDTTIQEVADELNFADQSSFSKFFKKNTGHSPIEFKNDTHLV